MATVIDPKAIKDQEQRILREQERIERERADLAQQARALDAERDDLADAALGVGRLVGITEDEIVDVEEIYALVGMTRQELLQVDIFSEE